MIPGLVLTYAPAPMPPTSALLVASPSSTAPVDRSGSLPVPPQYPLIPLLLQLKFTVLARPPPYFSVMSATAPRLQVLILTLKLTTTTLMNVHWPNRTHAKTLVAPAAQLNPRSTLSLLTNLMKALKSSMNAPFALAQLVIAHAKGPSWVTASSLATLITQPRRSNPRSHAPIGPHVNIKLTTRPRPLPRSRILSRTSSIAL